MRRFRWRANGICPFTCPVCQDAVLHERYRVVTELTRWFRKPKDLPYAEMVRCPGCGHAALVERGFGDGYTKEENDDAYTEMVRFFGNDHREVALADAYRNTRAGLLSNESRWQLVLNGFAHASYVQFVPPSDRWAAVPVVPELLKVCLVVFLLATGWVFLVALGSMIPPQAVGGAVAAVLMFIMLSHLVLYVMWTLWMGVRSWSPDAKRRRSSARISAALAPMLAGLDADSSILRDAKEAAVKNNWASAGVDVERVLEIIHDRDHNPTTTREVPIAASSGDVTEPIE